MKPAVLRLIHDLDEGVYAQVDDIAAWLLDSAQGQPDDEHGRVAAAALRASADRLIECIPAVDGIRR